MPINHSPYIPNNIQNFAPIYRGYGSLPYPTSNLINVNNNGISNIAENGGEIRNIDDAPSEFTSPLTVGGSTYSTDEPNQLSTNNYATNGGVINNTNENIRNTQNVGGNLNSKYIQNCVNCDQKNTNVQSNINNNKYLNKNTKNNANINNSNTY